VELDDGEWRWLSGAFLSIVFLAVVVHDSISSCAIPPPGMSPVPAGWCMEAWLNRYQTLIAGMFAFAGALLTVAKLNVQIRQTSESAEDRRDRQEIASRAKLLMALNVLSDYSTSCVRMISSLHQYDPHFPKIIVPDHFKLPELPMHAVGTMESCLEYTRKDRINAVHGVLTWLQIQHSRIGDDTNIKCSITARDNALFDAVQLKVLIDKLFNYARRRQEDSVDKIITEDDFKRVAFLSNLIELDYPRLFELIKQTNWTPLLEYL
jgi:hypothetical protein